MSDLSPILDYAGPRPRERRTRLPAESVLTWAWDRDGRRVEVIETLAGKAGAVGALVFAGFVLILLAAIAIPMARHGGADELILPGVVWLTEFGLMLAVINNTWRRTELSATVDGLRLRFRAPLLPRREDWWRHDSIGEVAVNRVVLDAYVDPLFELEVRAVNVPAARLFTGHPQPLLAEVAD